MFSRKGLLLSFLSLSLGVSASPIIRQTSFPPPEPCTGNCSWVHDPAITRLQDGSYVRLSTEGDIAIATAPELTGPWTYQGAMLPGGSKVQVVEDQQLWAPDIFFVDGTYYVFYAISLIGYHDSRIGVATSPSLEVGSFTDQGAIDIGTDPTWNQIDPNLFRQAEGEPFYFTFGSGWDAVFQTQLTLESGFISQPAGVTPQQVAFNSTIPAGGDIPSITEGVFQFWWPDAQTNKPRYYLFISSGACCAKSYGEGELSAPGDEYKVLVCRSDSPTGPFVDQAGKDCRTENGGTLILGTHDNIYAPGGQSVFFDTASQRVVMTYHYVDANLQDPYLYENFLFGFNYLDFSTGWPVLTT